MKNLEQIIDIISRGDTQSAEVLFEKPGGRKHLESIVLVVVTNLPYSHQEKIDFFTAFLKLLDKLEERIRHQREGQKILSNIFS